MLQVPIEIVKAIRRECLYSGCHDPALEDSDLCGPHEAHERGRAATRQRRRRRKLARAGLCIAGCGRKVVKRGRTRPRRCSACRKAHRQAQAARDACVTGDPAGVTGAASERPGNWRPDYDPETGAEWQRYRGKGRRGRLSREEQIDERIRDVRFAIEYLQEAQRRLERLKEPAVLELPKIQLEAVHRLAAEPIGSASRICDELVAELG